MEWNQLLINALTIVKFAVNWLPMDAAMTQVDSILLNALLNCQIAAYHINCENRKNLCHKMTEMVCTIALSKLFTMPFQMTSACAATCGFCDRGPCADTANGCIGLRSMCRHHKEFGGDLMQCARTCGFCTAKCVDLSKDCGIAEQSACARPPDDHPEENV